jgi:hypothetical protein
MIDEGEAVGGIRMEGKPKYPEKTCPSSMLSVTDWNEREYVFSHQ